MVGNTGLTGYVPLPGIARNELLNLIGQGVCRVEDAARVADVYGVHVKDVLSAQRQASVE